MRYIRDNVPADTPRKKSSEGDRFSSYGLWSSLDATRFAISRLRELELSRFGLTVEQASVLKVLIDADTSLRARDLENATLRQHQSVSTLINRMMRLSLLAKDRRPGEKRYRIFVTDSGRRLFGRITTAAIDVTFSALDEKDKKQLAVYLRPLHARARDLLGVHPVPSRKAVSSSV